MRPVSLVQWFRLTFIVRQPRAAKRVQRRRLFLDQLEDRITPDSVTTVTLDSSSPVSIPVSNTAPGQTITLVANFSTTDPNDQSEGEPLVIQGSDGYSQTISNYGTQTVRVPITQKNETLSAYITGADGDETATISVGDRQVQVQFDLGAFAAPWLSYADDMLKAEQMIEQLTHAVPGFQYYSGYSKPQFTGNVSGAISLAPDGQIDGGSVQFQMGITASYTAEWYWGFPLKVSGVSISVTGAISVLLTGTASWDAGGHATYTGQIESNGTLTVAGNAYIPFFRAQVAGQVGIQFPLSLNSDGFLSGGVNATGQFSLAMQEQTLRNSNYVTIYSAVYPIGPAQLAQSTIDITPDIQAAIKAAEGDPLVITSQPPSTVTAGQPFSVTVTAENPDGSTNTSYNGPVSIYDDYGYTLGGNTTAQFVNGVATFTGLTEDTAAPYDELYAYTSSDSVYTNTFAVDAAQASQLVLDSPSGVVTNGSFQQDVYAEDPYGNIDPTFSGNVTLALGTNPGNATLGGTLVEAAVNGVATFSPLTIDQPGTGYTLKAIATGLASGITDPFDVTDQLAFTTEPPAAITAGTPFGLAVTVEDGTGAVDTAFDGSVTLSDGYGYKLGGTTTVQAVNGVATFSGLTEDTAEDYDYLVATATGEAEGYSDSFTVDAAQASQLVLYSPSGVVTNGSFQQVVDAEDPYGNIDPTFSGNVTLLLGTNPGNATLGGTLTEAAVNGVATFSPLTINQAGIGYTLKATATGLAAGTSGTFDVSDKLVVTTQPPATISAGTPFGLAVTVEDGAGNVNATFNGSITVTDADGYPLVGTTTVQAVNGVATFSGLTETEAEDYGDYLIATATGETSGDSNSFTVDAGAATKLVLAAPSGVVANTPFGLTVYAEDQYGNTDPTFSGKVTVALGANPGSATLGGTLTETAANGVATFSGLTISQVGAGYTLLASATGLPNGSTTAFSVTDELVVTTQPPATITAGKTFGLVVTVEDGSGNTDTSFNGDVTATDAYGFQLGGTSTVQAVNGVATFTNLTETEAQDYGDYLILSGNNLAPADTNTFTVTAAPASLLVVNSPGGVVANGAFSLTVDAEDPYGNTDTTFAGNVTVSLGVNPGNSTLGGTVTVAAVAGVATFSNLTITHAANNYTLVASSPGLQAGTSAAFDVSDRLVVTTQPPTTMTAATPFGLVVKAEDGAGNVDTSFNGKVTLADDLRDALGGTITVQAVNGVATFSGLTEDTAESGGDYLIASAVGELSGDSSQFTVTPAGATQLVVSTPSGVAINGAFTVTVSAEDPYFNINPSFTGNVTLALAANPGTATLGGTLTATAVSGVATFSNLTLNQTGTGFTLKGSAAGLTAGVSSPFPVSYQLVVTTQPPPTITAGTPFGMSVTVEDGKGAIDTAFNGTVTVGDGDGNAIGGTTSVQAVNGVAVFAGLTLARAEGSDSLTVSASGLLSGSSQTLIVNPGPAAVLVVFSPANVIADGPFELYVEADDAYGNVATGFSGMVKLELAAGPANASLGGTLSVQAYEGYASFYPLTIDTTGSGFEIQASSTGLTSATTSPFPVTDQLVVTTQPPNTLAAGSTFGVTVAAENGIGTVDTSFTGEATVNLSSFAGALVNLQGTVTVPVFNGVATFSGLSIGQAGYYALTFSTSSLPYSYSDFFTVTAGQATQLQATTEPLANVTAGAPFGLVVSAEDGSGNVDTSFNGTVTLALAANPGQGTLGGTLTAQAVNGVATFTNLSINAAATGYTIQATAAGLTAAVTTTLNVTLPGVATQLVVTGQPPSSVEAGSSFDVVVKAEDGFGTVDTSFTGPVTVTDSNGNVLGQLSAVNGVVTFTGLTLDQVVYPYGPGLGNAAFPLTVSASGLPSVQTNAVAVTAAPATQLQVQQPYPDSGVGPVLAAMSFDLVVNAVDQYGNVDPTFNGTVTIALTGGSGTLSGTLTAPAYAGVATFYGLSINAAGTGYTVTATSNGLTPGSSAPISLGTDQLVLTTEPPSSLPTGAKFDVQVTAENGAGAVDPTFDGSVTLSLLQFNGSTGTLSGTLTAQAVNGVASFSGLSVNQGGSYALSVSSSLPPASSTPFAVTPIASRLAVTAEPPTAVTAGAGFTIQVAAEDAGGDTLSNYSGAATLTLVNNPGGATLNGSLSAPFVNGIATFSGLNLSAAGAGYEIQAAVTGLPPATTQTFDVTAPGTATQLVVTSQPPASIGSGSGFGMVVKADDSFGTVDTSFTGNVTVAIETNPGLGTLSGTVTVQAVNGVATFTGLTLNVAGDYILSASSTAFTTTASLTVTPATATNLAVQGPSAPVLIGSAFNITVNTVDAAGNVDPTFGGNVTLSLTAPTGGGSLVGTLTVKAVNGVATFTGLTITGTGTNYVLQATAQGLTSGTSDLFNVTTDILSVSTQPPAGVTAGAKFGLTIEAETDTGAVDTSFNGAVTLSLNQYFGATGVLAGPLTANAVDGVATVTNLSVSAAGTYAVTATAASMAAALSGFITINPGTATQLVVTAQPTADVTTGADFSLTIAAEDSNGNPDPTFNGPVTLAIGTNPGSGALGGTLMVTAVNGIATFSNLTLSAAGSGYTLQASVAGLPSVTTGPIDVTAPGTPTQLVMTTQPPSEETAGDGFGLTVEVEDGLGTIVSNFNGTVTVADPNGGSPLGQTTAVNGVATFTGLTLDVSGTYALTVSGDSLTGMTNLITIDPQAATQFQVLSPAGAVTPNSSFGVDVLAVDGFGNLISTFNGTVTLTLSTNPGNATLGGTLTAQMANGLVTFQNLTIDQAGSGYVLQASGSGLTAGTSPPIDVTTDQLVVTTQPPATDAADTGFGLTVAAETASGSVDTTFDGLVTASLIILGTNSATLGGTLTATAVNGVATFSGLTVDQAGTYALSLTSNGVGNGTSQNFSVVVPQVASLANSFVTVAPDIIQSGGTTTVTLQAVTGSGQFLTTGGLTVTFGLGGTSGATGTFGKATDNGNGTYTATFTGVLAGGNTITATIGGQAVTSTPPTLTVTPGTASTATSEVSLATGSIQAGGTATVTLHAKDAAGNALTSGGLTVAFELTGGGTGTGTFGPVTDKGNGTYTATFTGELAGNADITATIASALLATAPAAISVTPGAVNVADSTLQLAFENNPLAGTSAAVQLGGVLTLTIQARDAYGNANPTGVTAADFTLGGSGTAGTIGAIVNDGNGVYTATFTGTAAGSNTILATLNGSAVGTGAAPTVTVSGNAVSATKSKLSIKSATVTAGGGTLITFQAEDAKGNKETGGGLTVAFMLTSTKGGQGTFGPVTDNGNGTYTVTFTGSTAGSNSITATISGVKGSPTAAAVKVVAGTYNPVRSEVTASATTVKAGTKVTLTLQPEDAYGNKVSQKGLTVGFAVGSQSLVAKYQSNGTYTASYTATTAGTFTVGTTIDGQAVTSAPPTITVTPGAASPKTSLLSVSSETVSVGGAITVMLQAEDAYGNKETTGGLKVLFKLASKKGGQGTFGTVTDNHNGTYTVTFNATAQGSNTIEATIAGVAVSSTQPVTIGA